ncbi:MAG TPA: FeoA family protein [Candidatus Binatia bacterium]|nr:FeoA family protein [Candidatus Binatia bacterium]
MRLPLSDLELGETAVIENVALPEAERQLLMRFGFFDGAEVRCSRRAPLGDPVVYSVDGSEVALRTETACRIFASPVDDKATREQKG